MSLEVLIICALTWHIAILSHFTGAWPRAMGFLGAVAGSAAGAILSSTRRGTRPSEHAVWMAFGAAMGIEGTVHPAGSPSVLAADVGSALHE